MGHRERGQVSGVSGQLSGELLDFTNNARDNDLLLRLLIVICLKPSVGRVVSASAEFTRHQMLSDQSR